LARFDAIGIYEQLIDHDVSRMKNTNTGQQK
jgi:hypothetical protein